MCRRLALAAWAGLLALVCGPPSVWAARLRGPPASIGPRRSWAGRMSLPRLGWVCVGFRLGHRAFATSCASAGRTRCGPVWWQLPFLFSKVCVKLVSEANL